MLHKCYDEFIRAVIENHSEELKKKVNSTQCLEGSYLVMNFITETKNDSILNPHGYSMRKGNLGHITQLSNFLIRQMSTYDIIKQEVEKTEGWQAYVNEILMPRNTVESKSLGGRRPQNNGSNLNSEDELQMREIMVRSI